MPATTSKEENEMKKYNRLFLTLAVFTTLLFSSCHAPVFYYIKNDVVSEKASVNGVIRSIARYTTKKGNEYIVTVGSSGFLYKKVYDAASKRWTEDTQAHGKWTLVDSDQLPFSLHHYDYTTAKHFGQQIIKIISDSTTLYVFTVDYKIDMNEGTSCPDNIYIWAVQPQDEDSDGKWNTLNPEEDWTELVEKNPIIDLSNAFYMKDDYYFSEFTPFSTNAPKQANRKAYFRVANPDSKADKKNLYYELSDKIVKAKTISKIVGTEDSADKTAVKGAAYFNGEVHFFTTSAITTNETKDDAATVIYWGNGRYINYAKDSIDNIHSKHVDARNKVSALAFCEDTLLIGRGEINSQSTSSFGGIQKVDLEEDDIPKTELGTFTTNAQTQLLSSYMISVLFNTNPAKNELDSSLYAGLYFIGSSISGSFNNEGLWAYYPSRRNWNRE